MKKLVIIESPAKVKTVSKYLNELKAYDFEVIATVGHIINLDEDSMSITLKDSKFYGDFKIIKSKQTIVNKIKKLASDCKEIYICTDDDREGERIADDIVHACKIKKYYRVTFSELTKKAISLALIQKHGIRTIDENIVLAQWTRRMIDRIIGYGLSPIITYCFKKNNTLSYTNEKGKVIHAISKGTGRVIAIALALLANRQEKIEQYNERGATLTDVVVANYMYEGVAFTGRGEGLEFKKENSDAMQKAVNTANYKIHRVYERTREVETLAPYHPFTTASLYSACSFLYELSSNDTRKIIQELYETGYINYPRTDSVFLSDDIADDITKYLFLILPDEEKMDILQTKRKYKQKSKFAQEAHEAVRPLYFQEAFNPENIEQEWGKNNETKHFANNHKQVYNLIWYRTMCTQLKDSEYDKSKVTIQAGEHTFLVQANDRYKDGWERHYGELLHASTKNAGNEDWKSKRIVIPKEISRGDILEDVKVDFYEKSTRAPKRITEGALITMLTNMGVSRPSSLHTIVKNLVDKKYAESARTLLTISDLGMEIFKIQEQYLPWLNDVKEARKFEETIEEIEKGDITDVHALLMEYWNLVEKFKVEVGYKSFSDRKPSEKQLSFANSLLNKLSSSEKQKHIESGVLLSQKAVSSFIDKAQSKK